MTTQPALSVIVVSFSQPSVLRQCLASFASQTMRNDVQILVVRDWNTRGDAEESSLKSEFRDFVWIDAPAGTTVPAMRKLAFTKCSGTLVGFTEDDCVVEPDWCAKVVDAHKSENVAIGGSVEPGDYARSLDWAVFFCEYARFMRPFAGAVPALPGNNITYKASDLKKLLDSDGSGGVYEVFVNGELQKSGETLKADPSFSVRNINSWNLTNLTDVPFHHGRGFAAMRLASKPLVQRLPFLGIAMVLPAVQITRIGRQIVSKGRHVEKFIQCLPHVGLFCVSWSIGEFVGYLMGPGTSLKEWR
ncbi:MAG TPA: glycosyltransferase [Drouetiella sp.]